MKRKTKFLSLLVAFLFIFTLIPVQAFANSIGGEGGTTTGDNITLTKTLTAGKDNDGSYDLELTVKGQEVTVTKPVDITIVVDISNTMEEGGRIPITQNAINTFLDEVMPADNTNSKVRVSFATYGRCGWAYNFVDGKFKLSYDPVYGDSQDKQKVTSNTKNELNNSFTTSKGLAKSAVTKIGNLNEMYYKYSDYSDFYILRDGRKIHMNLEARSTNVQQGMEVAQEIMSKQGRKDAKHIVIFMTDGIPNSYGPNGHEKYSTIYASNINAFNAAVASEKALIDAGNIIYTVGLYTGLDNYSRKVANHLLSGPNEEGLENCVFKATKITVEDNVVMDSEYDTITKPGYPRHYYPVTDAKTAGENMIKCYKEIGMSVKAYAEGTVTETIPAEFNITNEDALINSGWTITHNEDETTTLTRPNVPAGADVYNTTNPKINIMPKPEYYGCAYTNENADGTNGAVYDYVHYDETKIRHLEFVRPFVFLDPTVSNDFYAVNVDDLSNPVIDLTSSDENGRNITANDNAFDDNYICEDNGYKLNSRKIELSGNVPEGVSIDDSGKVTLDTSNNSLVDADKVEFDYTVTNTFIKETSSKALKSNAAHVTVYLVRNRAYVIDYGKLVTYKQNPTDEEGKGTYRKPFNGESDEVAMNEEKHTVQTDSSLKSTFTNGLCGKMSLLDKDINYTLTEFMDAVDTFNFKEKFNTSKEKEVEKSINMIPATAIYYEDNFGDGKENGIIFNGGWKTETTAYTGSNEQDPNQNGAYGYDSSYDGQYGFSGGSARCIVGDGKDTKASFTFTGTGFDIMSMTNSATGWAYMEVYNAADYESNNAGNEYKLPIHQELMCTEFNEKKYTENATNIVDALYQIPVLNWNNSGVSEKHSNSDVAITKDASGKGTYTVVITIPKEEKFYLDGLRIYNPLGKVTAENNKTAFNAYTADKELNPYICEVRDILLEKTSLENINGQTGTVFLEKNPANSNIGEYKNYGPKNEVYLKNQQGIAFTLSCEGGLPTSIQLGLKAPDGEAVRAGLYYLNGETLSPLATWNITSATDMNYELPEPKYTTNGGYISDDNTVTLVIKNEAAALTDTTTQANILAISNIKLGSQPSLKSVSLTAGASVLKAAKLAYAVDPSEPEEPEVDEAPVISGADSLTIKAGDYFEAMEGVTALDKEDGDLTSKITVNGEVDINSPGEYTVSYSVTDSHGNTTAVDRMVTVRSNDKPVISGTDNVTIKVGDTFDAMKDVTASDKEDGDLTSRIVVSGTVDCEKAGEYKITYSVKDSDENTTSVERVIIVEEKPSFWNWLIGIIRGWFRP